MRRKKLANKIVSILMADMMVVSTPMSALAVDTYAAENEAVVLQADEGASDAQVGSGYQIQVTECTHGTVTPSVEQAEQGDTVTLTVKPWG